jgi:hypothetical protein
MSAGPSRFKKEEGCDGMKRMTHAIVLLAALLALGAAEDPNRPPTPSERIAGRWRITLDGLPVEHQDLLASFAVEGDLLIGTLTVGRSTLNIQSGKVAGLDFSFAFRHGDGETFRMRGTVVERGLQGEWVAGNERGPWKAARLR